MLKRLVLIALLLIMGGAPIAHAAFWGPTPKSETFGSMSGAILYEADEKALANVDPLSVKQVSMSTCFGLAYHDPRRLMTVREIFATLFEEQPPKQRTILQVVRAVSSYQIECAALWFVYIEK